MPLLLLLLLGGVAVVAASAPSSPSPKRGPEVGGGTPPLDPGPARRGGPMNAKRARALLLVLLHRSPNARPYLQHGGSYKGLSPEDKAKILFAAERTPASFDLQDQFWRSVAAGYSCPSTTPTSPRRSAS